MTTTYFITVEDRLRSDLLYENSDVLLEDLEYQHSIQSQLVSYNEDDIVLSVEIAEVDCLKDVIALIASNLIEIGISSFSITAQI